MDACEHQADFAATPSSAKRRRMRVSTLTSRKRQKLIDPAISVRSRRKALSNVEDLPSSADLEIAPLLVDDSADVPDELTPEAAVAAYDKDEFTARWYCRYKAAVADKKRAAYGVHGVMSDTCYIHQVRELLRRGHLDDCGLRLSNPSMYAALQARQHRNARSIVFRATVVLPGAPAEAAVSCVVPVLYIVKQEATLTINPLPSDCVRVIPISQLRMLLQRAHEVLLCRITAVFKHMQQYYANVTRAMCDDYARHCNVCNRQKLHSTLRQPVHPILSRAPRERYVIDFIDMRNDADRGSCWILHMIDHASKYRWAEACKNKEAATVMRVVKRWWCEYGRPDILHSDNGGEFTADLIEELCVKWGVQKRHGRPYRPQTQGVVERANRQLNAYLSAWRAIPDNAEQGWVAALPEITRAANHAFTRAIKTTPHDAFPSTSTQRTLPGTFKADLNDKEDIDIDAAQSDTEGQEDDTRNGLLGVLRDVEGRESIADAIIGAKQRETEVVGPTLQDNCDSQEVLAEPEDSTLQLLPPLSRVHVASEPQAVTVPKSDTPLTASVAALHISESDTNADESGVKGELLDAALLKSSPSPDATLARTYFTSDVAADSVSGDDLECYELMRNAEQIDDPTRPLNSLHIIARGRVESLWFRQWQAWCEVLTRHVRVVGVVADGNCGPASAVSAHQQLFSRRRVATEVELRNTRVSVLTWVEKNRELYSKLNGGKADEASLLLTQCREDGRHVAPDFFRAYACMHKLNVFILAIKSVKFPNEQREDGGVKMNSSFSCRLMNVLDDGTTLLPADRANTMAVHFHHRSEHVGSGSRSPGVGHYEFVVDSDGRSLWSTTEPIVQQCLLVACKQTVCFRRLFHYAERMRKQLRDNKHDELFEVGMLANLQVRQKLRNAVSGHTHRRKNMYVRLLERVPVDNAARTFLVLSHGGVVSEGVPSYELAQCGQDVDTDLLTRAVSDDDRKKEKRVSLLTAWKFELARAPGRGEGGVTAGAQAVRSSADSVDDPSLKRITRASTASARTAKAPRTTATDRAAPSLTSSPPVEFICASCSSTFFVPHNQGAVRCLLCQQTLHTLAVQCSRSLGWVQTAGGRFCSAGCRRRFPR